MVFSRLFLLCSLLAAFSVACSAGTIVPGDPDIAMDAGSNSSPFSSGVNLLPTNGGGVFDFFNPFPYTITGVTFQVDIAGGISQSTIQSSFNCRSGFFLNCGFAYQDDTTFGVLTIDFSGVDPYNLAKCDTGAGKHEGIPVLEPSCTPLSATAPRVGHFYITLNDNFAGPPTDSGGWSDTTNPGLFNGPPDIIVTEILTPEPAGGILFGSVLLIGAAIVRRRTRGLPVA